MPSVLALDVYGTLVDPAGIAASLRPLCGDRAEALAGLWRDKQLEYSFRRGLMKAYAHFDVCTRDALIYACNAGGIEITEVQTQTLLEAYRRLPAFPEAAAALEGLLKQGHRLLAFSNGKPQSVAGVLEHAGLLGLLSDVVSVDEVRSFKPDPAVYAHFERRAGATAEEIWLVSANPFDVIGALGAGWRAAWVRRRPSQTFDPWGGAPTAQVATLVELTDILQTGA
jgi:2-haloacid dehalogenase